MTKRILRIAALLTLAASASAMAADLPAPAYKAPLAAPVYSWTGWYIGANAGYSWGRETNDWIFTGFGFGPFPAVSESQNMNGGIAGVQSGFNWQVNNQWVMGYESDIQWSGQRGSTSYCVIACGILNVAADHRLPWFGTARGRVGILVTPSVLLYGTAGIAYGETRSDYTLNILALPIASESFRVTRAGWTAGGGIEGMLAYGWSAKAEALYMDFGRDQASFSVLGAPVVQFNNRVTDVVARVGLNYRWGGGP